jgi:predicted RNA-binding Zn-ribbon protein involved in translation (DUF1610 family)
MRFFAELSDTDTGYLERAMLAGKWARLPVIGTKHGEHGNLRWEIPRGKFQSVGLGAKLLSDFLTLEQGTPADIEKYAHRWGVLGLCVHNLPIGHPDLLPLFVAEIAAQQLTPRAGGIWFAELIRMTGVPQTVGLTQCVPLLHPGRRWSERLDAWRWYAGTARRLLEMASKAREAPDPHSAATLRTQLECWLELAPMQLACTDEHGRLEPKLIPANPVSALSAVIAAQVCFAASGSKSLLHCSECGRVYFPKRKPTRGQDRYCPDCGPHAAWRAASRRHYEKRKAERSQRHG